MFKFARNVTGAICTALVSLQYVTPICHVLGCKQAVFFLNRALHDIPARVVSVTQTDIKTTASAFMNVRVNDTLKCPMATFFPYQLVVLPEHQKVGHASLRMLKVTACLVADEVRNFVTELAHIAYSRGVPAGSIPIPAAAGDPNLPTPPSSSGHMLQEPLVNLPAHLSPGHPSFDQHAYHLLQQQQQQHMAVQLQQLPDQQAHQHENLGEGDQADMKDELPNQHTLQGEDDQQAASEEQQCADAGEMHASGNLEHLD